METKREHTFIIEKEDLPFNDFLNKFLDLIEKAGYYYVLPGWMALKLNRLGDSGYSRGELESRQRRGSNILNIKSKTDAIEILNIANIRSFWGSYNTAVTIKDMEGKYNVYVKTYSVPKLIFLPFVFIISFILSVVFVKNILAVLILTFLVPVVFMKISQIKMAGNIEIPTKKIEETIDSFKNSLVRNKPLE